MTAFIAVAVPWLIAARLAWTLRAERREHRRQLDAVRLDAGTIVTALVVERARSRTLHDNLTRAVEFAHRQYRAACEARRWQVSR